MGLMLSVLIECIGVLEVIACYQHLSYGIQHALDEPKPELSKIKQNLRKELIDSDKHISLNEITRDVNTSEDFTSQRYLNENETHSCLIIEENKNLVTDENVYESVNGTITDPLHCLIFDSSNIESKLCSPELKNDSDYLQSDRIESKLLNESVHETTLNTNERELIDDYVNTQVIFNEDENSTLDKIVIEKDLNKFLQTPAVISINEHQHIEQNESTSKTATETETNEDVCKKNTLEQQNEHTQAGDEVTDNIREHLESDTIFDTELSDKISLHENIEILADNNTILNQITLISPGNYVEQISDVPSSNLVRVSENEIPLGNVISGPFESIEEVAILREVEALAAQETRSSETLEGIESIPIAEEILNNGQEEAVRTVNDEENVNERESASAVPVDGQNRVVNGIGELRGHFQVVPESDTSQSDPNDQAEYIVDVVLSQAEEDHHDHNDVGSISNDFGVVVYDLPVFGNAGARIVPSEYSEDQTTDEISELSVFTETDLTNSGPEIGMMPTTLYYHPESGSLIEIIHENYDDVASDVYSYDINPENVEIDERMSHSCLYNPDSVFYRPPSPFPDVEISLTRNELKIPECLYETDSNKSMDEELADKPKGKRVSFQDYVQTEEYEKDSLEDEPMIENQNVETILGQLNVEEIENEDSVNLSVENQKLLDDDSAQAVSALTKTDEIIAALKEMTSQKILEDGSKKETYTETEEFVERDYVFERETSPLYVEPYVLENVEESIKGRNQQLSYDFLTQASEDIIFDVVNANKNEQEQTIVSTVSEAQLNSVTETDAGNISLTPHKNERSKSPTSRINIQQSQTHDLSDELYTKSNQITLTSMNAASLEPQLSRGDSEVEFNTDTIVQTSINIQNKQLDECIISEESGEVQTETAVEKIETSTLNTMSEFIPKTQSAHLLEGKKVIQEVTCVHPLNKKEESNKSEETTTAQIQFDSKTDQLGDVIKSETIIGNVAPEINDEITDENVHFVENIIQSSREGIIKRYKQDQNNEIKRFDSEPILPQREDDLDDTTLYNTDFLNSLDGIKMNNLARDSGSWRRKNFRNRRSLSSNSSKSSSKASRDEELKMLTSLEESEQGITYETMKQNIGTDNIPEPETSAISEEKTTPHRRRRKHRSGKGGKQSEKNNFTQSVHSVLQDVTEIECGQSVTPSIDIINEEIMINDDNIEVVEANISDLSSKVSEDAPDTSSDILKDAETLERIEKEQAHASYEQKNQMKTLYKIASFEDASEGQHQEILLKRLSSKKDDDVSNNKTAEVPTTSAFSPRGDNTRNENNSDLDNATVSTSEERSNRSSSQAFWLIFSGEYTKAMNKDWHGTHFCCWQCDESLTGQRYVLRDDHPYCVACYESVFANGCEECNKIIGIDSKDLSYKDKHWHEACFLCTKCRVSLVDKQFGSKLDKIYCGNCYDAQFASRCDGCGEIFRAGTKKMEYKTRQWHEKCFCCCVCKTAIGTKSFIPREQEIYCAQCYEEKFATRCVKCNKIITSGGVTYKNEPWHRECFTCSNCNTSLAGQRFTSRDEKPYCADCFGELFAKRCTACSKPITGIGGTRFISFEERHWHNDCFVCATCRTSLVGRGFITDEQDIICPDCAKAKLM